MVTSDVGGVGGGEHSCFSPSSPRFVSRLWRDFLSILLSLWTALRSNKSSAKKWISQMEFAVTSRAEWYKKKILMKPNWKYCSSGGGGSQSLETETRRNGPWSSTSPQERQTSSTGSCIASLILKELQLKWGRVALDTQPNEAPHQLWRPYLF